MVKITPLSDLANLQSETTAVSTINTNNQRIEDALANTLSRDGSTPNTMSANLDLNSYRILNLPAAVADTEPVRKAEFDAAVVGLDVALLEEAVAAVDTVTTARDEAVQAAEDAASYIGSATSAQTWTTGRTFTYTGDVTGVSGSVNGSANVSIALSIAADTVSDTELTTGAAVANIGYTPANKAGDTFTGQVILPSNLTSLNQYSAGFLAVPVETKDADYTFVMNDSGRMKRHTSATGHAFTIPPNSSVAFPVGTVLLVRNIGSGVVTLTRGSGVALRIPGSATDGNKSVAQWGYVSILQEATDVWVATGTGIS